MNRNTVWSALIVGGAAIAGAAALGLGSGYNPLQKYATVVSVAPAFEETKIPRIVCGDEAVMAAMETQTAGGTMPPTAQSEAVPAPRQPSAAAAQGAETIPQCRTVFDTRQVESGFDVTYELDGVQRVVRMDRNPGSRIPVEDGELVLSRL